jgi:hypothetical protein
MPLEAEPEAPQIPPLPEGALADLLRNPDAPPWSGWDVVVIIVVFLLALIGATVLMIAVGHLFQLRLEKAVAEARVLVPLQLFSYLAALVALWLIARYSYRRRFWQALEWNWPSGRRGALLLVAGAPLALVLQAVQSRLPAPPATPMEKYFRTPGDVYLMGLLAVAAAPLMEEVFFRGLLYPVLRRWGVALAVVLTAAAFTLVHGSQYAWAWSAMLVLLVVGLALTLVRVLLRSVAAGFLLHLGYNLTLFVMLFLTTDHFRHMERGF